MEQQHLNPSDFSMGSLSDGSSGDFHIESWLVLKEIQIVSGKPFANTFRDNENLLNNLEVRECVLIKKDLVCDDEFRLGCYTKLGLIGYMPAVLSVALISMGFDAGKGTVCIGPNGGLFLSEVEFLSSKKYSGGLLNKYFQGSIFIIEATLFHYLTSKVMNIYHETDEMALLMPDGTIIPNVTLELETVHISEDYDDDIHHEIAPIRFHSSKAMRKINYDSLRYNKVDAVIILSESIKKYQTIFDRKIYLAPCDFYRESFNMHGIAYEGVLIPGARADREEARYLRAQSYKEQYDESDAFSDDSQFGYSFGDYEDYGFDEVEEYSIIEDPRYDYDGDYQYFHGEDEI